MSDFLIPRHVAANILGNHFYLNVPETAIVNSTVQLSITHIDGKVVVCSLDPVPEWEQYEVQVAPLDTSVEQQKLLDARMRVWEKIKEYRTNKSLNSGVLCNGKWFNTDLISRTQYERYYSKAVGILASNPSTPTTTILSTAMGPTYWKTMDNSLVPMTIGLIFDLMTAIENNEAAVFYRAEVHRGLLYASLQPDSYDYTTGWPPSFGET